MTGQASASTSTSAPRPNFRIKEMAEAGETTDGSTELSCGLKPVDQRRIQPLRLFMLHPVAGRIEFHQVRVAAVLQTGRRQFGQKKFVELSPNDASRHFDRL